MRPADHRALLTELSDAVGRARPVVVATIVDTARSVPRHAGAKMLVYGDGSTSGTVGGGQVEALICADALTALEEGTTRLKKYTLEDPERGDPGICGGTMTISLEPYMPPHTVLVIGCGHVGRAVVDLAHWLGYRTVATDDRAELITEEAMPNAEVRLGGSVEEALAAEPVSENTSIVVVTRSHDMDVEIVPLLLATPARYIGVMGSTRRWAATRERLIESGVAAREIDRIHVPIGLNIGAETVEEIAVSIMSEVIEAAAAEGL
ncbi:MAG: XdhC/CoxI family protein [Acidimicrobiia bacterium]